MTKISVIGAGNGGLTAAYHFAKMGHEVCIYDDPKFDSQIKAIQKSGGIEALKEEHGLEMILPGFSKMGKATTDIEEAMNFSDLFVMICPSFAQEILFESMIPYLKDKQTVVLMPGNYGGLVLNKQLKDSDKAGTEIAFVDAITIPWATRISSPGVITVMGLKEFLPLSIFSENGSIDGIEETLSSIMPIPVEVLDNPIVAGLENINFGGHPLLTTLNMGLLENFDGNFNYYRDCCSTATAKAAAKMDKERLSVGGCLELDLRTELEAMNALYDSNYETVYEFNRASTTHAKITSGPNSSKARYVSEDVPYLLVPCYELASLCDIKVPIVESCIHIASAYNDTDYFKTGRTLEKMGFKDHSKQELMDYLKTHTKK